MKQYTFTVIPPNMQAYKMSVREPDIENDLYRIAFESALKEDPISYSDPNIMLVSDFFQYGWRAAVAALNDDDERKGIPKVDMQRNAFFGTNQDGSQVFKYSNDEWVSHIEQIKMHGWLCFGPSNTQVDITTTVLNWMSNEDRLEVFSKYCCHCGTDQLPCHCSNDE